MSIVSIVVPVYNEQDNIRSFYLKLSELVKSLPPRDSFEVIFINDGSSDRTQEMIGEISTNDSRVRYLEFSRNFGKEIATSAGLHYASGDAVIMLDCDLQHPVELIPEFLRKWRAGADVVVGLRKSNHKAPWFRRMGSYFYYKILNAISDCNMQHGSTDYRLIDRKVVTEFRRFGEHNRMTRSLIDWLGFRRDFVEFDAPARANGNPSYSISRLISLAISGFISNSLTPLRAAGYLGAIITLLSGLAGLYVIIGRYILHEPFTSSFSGSAQLAILIVFLVGIILGAQGIVGLYIASIHYEVLNKPMYIIRDENITKSLSARQSLQ